MRRTLPSNRSLFLPWGRGMEERSNSNPEIRVVMACEVTDVLVSMQFCEDHHQLFAVETIKHQKHLVALSHSFCCDNTDLLASHEYYQRKK